MLTGYNWTRQEILKLKDHPTLWNKVTTKLRTIPVDQKVLRWPDGNESIVAIPYVPFDAESNAIGIQFCQESGIEKVVFRADFQDVEGSINTYEQFIEAGLEVTYVEAGNEPYFPPQVNPTWNELVQLFWDFTQWNVNMETRVYRLKAKQYSVKVKNLRQAFADRGHTLTGKFAYAIPVVRYFKEKEWLRVCMKHLPKAEYPIVVQHIYNQDKHGEGEWDIWKQETIQAIRQVTSKGLRWIETEANAIHFGAHGQTVNVSLGNTDYHVEKNIDLMLTSKAEGCELFNYHKLAGFDGNRKFHKWDLDIPRLTLTDRQPNFELNPELYESI